jgi:Secretion system C-terminal sorting domain
MRLLITLLVAGAFLLFEESAAQNLIPNGSFEEFEVDCVQALQYYQLADWTQPDCAEDPVVLHRCNEVVPHNEYGYQESADGDAYIYIWTLRMNSSGGFPDGNPQWYPSVNLTEPLVAGQTYCLRLRVNLADSSNYRTGALHAFLWYGVPSTCNYNDTMWDTYAAVTFDISQVDTATWTTLEGSFTASGSESNLTLGAFQYDEEIDSVLIAHDYDQIGDLAVYFLDDVELWACEVGVNEAADHAALNTWPNPASDALFVELPGTDMYVLQVYDAVGRKVLGGQVTGQTFPGGTQGLDVSGLVPGRYVLQAQTVSGRAHRAGFVVAR